MISLIIEKKNSIFFLLIIHLYVLEHQKHITWFKNRKNVKKLGLGEIVSYSKKIFEVPDICIRIISCITGSLDILYKWVAEQPLDTGFI